MIEGVVKNITDYGAFVDLGGIDGLLHVTDISYKRVNHPSEVLGHRRHGEGADHPHQPRNAAHFARHEAARKRSVGGRGGQISGRRRVPRPGHQHHRIWRLRRARAGHRGPGPRLRDELDQEERPPGQDRLHFAGSRRQGARGRRGEAPDFARPQAGPGQSVGGVRRGASGRLDRRGRGQECDRVRAVRRARGRRRRHGPHVGHRLGRVGRGSARAPPQGRDGQGPGARRRCREGAHFARHEAA